MDTIPKLESKKFKSNEIDKLPTSYDFTNFTSNAVSKFGNKDNSYSGYGSNLGNIAGLASNIISSATNEYTAPTQYDDLSINSQELNTIDDLMSRMSSNRLLVTNRNDYVKGYDNAGARLVGSAAKGFINGISSGNIYAGIAGLVLGGASSAIDTMKQVDAEQEAWTKDRNRAKRINDYNKKSFVNDSNRLSAQNYRLSAMNAAYGGPLGASLLPVSGAIDYMQNEELLSTLGDNMSQSNRKVSTPIFAFGGALGGYGGDWSNGLNFIKAGKRHEQNPIGGVPMGVAQDGMPNLVEEGEVVWNDYVFSNRINVPKETMEKLGIKGKDTMTFAEAVEKVQKSSAERPNDPIEKRGLEAVLTSLMQKQEEIRQLKAEKEQFNEMEDMAAFAADGGPIHIAKNKKGTFTAAATKHGMGVQEFADHVLANKDKYSSAMVKKAQFAHNAKSWSHADGGHLFDVGGHYDIYGNWIPNNYRINGTPSIGTLYNDVQNPYFKEEYKFNTTPKFTMPTEFSEATGIVDKSWQPPTTLNFKPEPIVKKQNTYDSNDKGKDLPTSGWQTALRYAPVLGSAIGLGYTLFNKPDYEYANELSDLADTYANQIGHNIMPRYLGDYLTYNPFDRLFYANELRANQAATNSAITNIGNNNLGAILAARMANDYNNNIALGKLFREGEEYNLNQRHKVAEFNRATNQFNSEADLKAQMFNAELDKVKASLLLNAKIKALGMKQADDLAYQQALMANLSGLFDNLGGIGTEAQQKYWMNGLINSGWAYTPSEDMLAAWGYPRACGGKMNRRKKKGITI